MSETACMAALIIPALNEEQSLAVLLREVPPLKAGLGMLAALFREYRQASADP